ncbi:MAG: single-stranded DNA-binding protein [Candidatus Cryptobacteroides sp.]|nr:single-stranded DNA-binding protein [Candidatus Cryptobacteroides sp.]
MSLNKVMLIGNVGSDPEVRYLENNPQNPGNNVKVATVRLATTERYRDRNGEQRENTEWHTVVLWRNNADVAEKYVHKGSQIYIEGKLRTRQWTDQTGNKRYTTEVVADTLQLLGKRPEGESQAQGGYQGGYAQGGQPAYQGQGGYQPQAPVQSQYAAQPQYAGQSGAAPSAQTAAPVAQPAGPAAPAGAPSPAAQPVNPAYRGPLPAAEPSDDLPF